MQYTEPPRLKWREDDLAARAQHAARRAERNAERQRQEAARILGANLRRRLLCSTSHAALTIGGRG